jgi:hypothetical protein
MQYGCQIGCGRRMEMQRWGVEVMTISGVWRGRCGGRTRARGDGEYGEGRKAETHIKRLRQRRVIIDRCLHRVVVQLVREHDRADLRKECQFPCFSCLSSSRSSILVVRRSHAERHLSSSAASTASTTSRAQTIGQKERKERKHTVSNVLTFAISAL